MEFTGREIIAGGVAAEVFDLGRPGQDGDSGQVQQLRSRTPAGAYIQASVNSAWIQRDP